MPATAQNLPAQRTARLNLFGLAIGIHTGMIPADLSVPDHKFGVEIEFENLNTTSADRTIQDLYANHRLQPWNRHKWKIVYDGSVGSNGGEAISPPMSGTRGFVEIGIICESLKNAGATVAVNCGIHCHINAVGTNVSTIKNLFKLCYKHEPSIFAMVSDSRRPRYMAHSTDREQRAGRQYHYCKQIQVDIDKISEAQSLYQIENAWYVLQNGTNYRSGGYNETRYHGFNFHAFAKHGTFEFRYFQGSLNPNKIIAYVIFCLSMVELATSARHIRNVIDNNDRNVLQLSGRQQFEVMLRDLHITGPGLLMKTARKALVDRFKVFNRHLFTETEMTRPVDISVEVPADTVNVLQMESYLQPTQSPLAEIFISDGPASAGYDNGGAQL